MYKLPEKKCLSRTVKRGGTRNGNATEAVERVLSAYGISYNGKEILAPTIQRVSLQVDFKSVKKVLGLEKVFQYEVGDNRVALSMEGGRINIDIPNRSSDVLAGDLIDTLPEHGSLLLPIGMDIAGNVVSYALDKMPHMLVAGCTGSGKSVFLNMCISALLSKHTPDEVELILVDPKRVEFSVYDGCHGVQVITDTDKAIGKLRLLNLEMQKRYSILAKAGARDIDEYNANAKWQLPKIVLVVDELSQLMSGKDKKTIEADIVKIAQLSRAAGIHMVLATQYPVASVVTGLIKQNIPCKVCLQTTNQTGSVVMIGRKGAEKLMGKGDMLFLSPETDEPVRLQGAYISTQECYNVAAMNTWNHRKLFGGWK